MHLRAINFKVRSKKIKFDYENHFDFTHLSILALMEI